jgi:hypothetical protein
MERLREFIDSTFGAVIPPKLLNNVSRFARTELIAYDRKTDINVDHQTDTLGTGTRSADEFARA